MTGLAFPKFDLYFLGWLSLLPLLFVLHKRKPVQALLLGWISGFSFYAVLIYWIPAVPAHYGNISWELSFVVYLIFITFLGLFWACFSFLYAKIQKGFPRSIYLIAPFLWVTFEYILTYCLTGFPWGLLGYSQYKNLPLIQMSSLTGVYGIAFVLLLFQCLFVYSMNFRKKSPFLFAVGTVAVIHLVGLFSIKDISPDENSFQSTVVQGNIQADTDFSKLSTQEISELFQRHLDLSHQAATQGSRLIIWPELSVPFCFSCAFSYFPDFTSELVELSQENDVSFLLGTNEIKRTQDQILYYNTASFLRPDLSLNFYHKMHLVPFGEYTPYRIIFSFISKFTHAIGELTPGSDYILHQFEGLNFASPICYEIIFPEISRKFVKKGASFLITITNDGWYGKSSAPFQHFTIAVFRAVENRRFVLRAATTGVSGIIDPFGRILSRSELDTETFLSHKITPNESLTFYTRYGEILPYTSLTISAIFLILTMRKNVRKRKLRKTKLS